ncbi:hypothetical protein LC613_13760 [Nostoc sphaeroides CHAB 2801]|uniref:hypothetical protein n=1 Tax=Nostoc sphaeroides TaxID=446679 RepID=UPI000E544629|nr:hypothetical protein [Nostoc sphaeroides]MCC5629082.1 hypothetical protein [Nostoc sphaeroides CHAB 2801]
MAEPTLVQVFGAGATQDASTLTIQKSALADKGLTISASNTAESLLAAIVLLTSSYLNETSQATNTDIQITIADSGYPQIITRNSIQYRQTTYNVNFQKVDDSTTLDPDNF